MTDLDQLEREGNAFAASVEEEEAAAIQEGREILDEEMAIIKEAEESLEEEKQAIKEATALRVAELGFSEN